MPDRNDVAARIKDVVNQRVALETTLQNEVGEPSEASAASYDAQYGALQKQLATLFRETVDDAQRITVMLELMRILENRLVYLHNFIVDPTSDNRVLAQLVTKFIDQLAAAQSTVLTKLEATYYRAVAGGMLPLLRGRKVERGDRSAFRHAAIHAAVREKHVVDVVEVLSGECVVRFGSSV